MLNAILGEQSKEYRDPGDMQEMADLATGMWGGLEAKGLSKEHFEQMGLDMQRERGTIHKRLFLEHSIGVIQHE